MTDVWALWPDYFMCPQDEINFFTVYRSDDYMLVDVISYDESGEPSVWKRKPTTSIASNATT